MNVPFRNNTRFLVLNLAILWLPFGFLRVSRIKILSLRCSEAWLRTLLYIISLKINTKSFNNGKHCVYAKINNSTIYTIKSYVAGWVFWNQAQDRI